MSREAWEYMEYIIKAIFYLLVSKLGTRGKGWTHCHAACEKLPSKFAHTFSTHWPLINPFTYLPIETAENPSGCTIKDWCPLRLEL